MSKEHKLPIGNQYNFKNKSTVTQGSIGLGQAIAYFASLGHIVCVPLTDNQDYDLIIDIEGKLNKVQVKTSGTKSRQGIYVVQLKSVRSNKNVNNINNFDKSKVDFLFIVTEEGKSYCIPMDDNFKPKSGLNLGSKYDKFLVCGGIF